MERMPRGSASPPALLPSLRLAQAIQNVRPNQLRPRSAILFAVVLRANDNHARWMKVRDDKHVPMQVLGTIIILSAVLATPVSAKHHGRIHYQRHYQTTNTWQYAPCGYVPYEANVPHALHRIDPSRPGGLDSSFTPRGR